MCILVALSHVLKITFSFFIKILISRWKHHIETHWETCALSGLNQRPAHASVFLYGEGRELRYLDLLVKSQLLFLWAIPPLLPLIETHWSETTLSPTCTQSRVLPMCFYMANSLRAGFEPALSTFRYQRLPIPSPRVPEVNYSPAWMLPADNINHIETH